MSSKDTREPLARRGRAAAASRPKPYTRIETCDSPEDYPVSPAGLSPALSAPLPPHPHPQPPPPPQHAGTQHQHASTPPDILGFPSFDEYKRLEAAYLNSLSDRKQGKALIPQAMFEQIWDVLHDPECLAGSAQFRFWVRKMFVLRFPQTTLHAPASDAALTPVVLHDNRPVAIREQLYEVLCYCHALARHGGRDKTCAAIRAHYSWVPKELTAKFVKACPTCTLKRSGNPELFQRVHDQAAPLARTLSAPAGPDVTYFSPFGEGPNDPLFLRMQRERQHEEHAQAHAQKRSLSEGTLPQAEFSPHQHDDDADQPYRRHPLPVLTLSGSPCHGSSDCMDSLPPPPPVPMQRAPALFGGLPLAWAFEGTNEDAEVRYAHMLAMDAQWRAANGGPGARLPDFEREMQLGAGDGSGGSDSHPARSGEPQPVYLHRLLSADDVLAPGIALPPLMHALSDGDAGAGREVGIMRYRAGDVFPHVHAHGQRQTELQIDPALLMDGPGSGSGSGSGSGADDPPTHAYDGAEEVRPTLSLPLPMPSPRASSTSSIFLRRAPAPLDLSRLDPAAYQYRNPVDPAGPSPTCSSAGTGFTFSGAPSPVTPAFAEELEDAGLVGRAGGLCLGSGGGAKGEGEGGMGMGGGKGYREAWDVVEGSWLEGSFQAGMSEAFASREGEDESAR